MDYVVLLMLLYIDWVLNNDKVLFCEIKNVIGKEELKVKRETEARRYMADMPHPETQSL